MFLLDTDMVIYSLKGNDAVKQNLRTHINDPIKITAVTLMELYYGAYKSQKVTANLARLKMIESNMEIISLDEKSAEIYGMIKADLENRGIPLDDFDIMIASCTLVHNLTLVTNNIKHFKRIDGLRLANWAVIE
jgi:predicted nucleic acid-binding protein